MKVQLNKKKSTIFLFGVLFFLIHLSVYSQTRYWVGGTGSWTNTARWSTTSGGAGGASVPLSTDDVVFDAASGSGTLTIPTGATNLAKSVTFQAATNMTVVTGTGRLDVNADVTFKSGMVLTAWTGTLQVYTPAAVAVTRTITTGNNSLGLSLLRFELPSSGAGGNVVVNGNLTMSNLSCIIYTNLQSKTNTVDFNNNVTCNGSYLGVVGTGNFRQDFSFTIDINTSLGTAALNSWGNGSCRQFLSSGDDNLNAGSTITGNTYTFQTVQNYVLGTGSTGSLNITNCNINITGNWMYGYTISGSRFLTATGSTITFLASATEYRPENYIFNNVVINDNPNNTYFLFTNPWMYYTSGHPVVPSFNTLICDRNTTFNFGNVAASHVLFPTINTLFRLTPGHRYVYTSGRGEPIGSVYRFNMNSGSTLDMQGTCNNPIWLDKMAFEFGSSVTVLSANIRVQAGGILAVNNTSPYAVCSPTLNLGTNSFIVSNSATYAGWGISSISHRNLVWVGGSGCGAPPVITLPSTPVNTSSLTTQGLNFNITQTCMLNSVDVYATNTSTTIASINFRLYNSSGTILNTINQSIPAGVSDQKITITFNTTLPVGTYSLTRISPSNTTFFRYNTTETFPINITSNISCQVGSITGGVPTASNYYMFYNWNVSSLSSANNWYDSNNWVDVTSNPTWSSNPSIAPNNSGYSPTCPPTHRDSVIFPPGSYPYCDKLYSYCEGVNWQGTGMIQGTLEKEMEVWGSLYLSPTMQNEFKGTYWFKSDRPYMCWITTNNQPFDLGAIFDSDNGNGQWLLRDTLILPIVDPGSINGYRSMRLSRGTLNTGTSWCTPGNGQCIKAYGMELIGGTFNLYDSRILLYGSGAGANSGTSPVASNFYAERRSLCNVNAGTSEFIFKDVYTQVGGANSSPSAWIGRGQRLHKIIAQTPPLGRTYGGSSTGSFVLLLNQDSIARVTVESGHTPLVGACYLPSNPTGFPLLGLGANAGLISKLDIQSSSNSRIWFNSNAVPNGYNNNYSITIDTLLMAGGADIRQNIKIRSYLSFAAGSTYVLGSSTSPVSLEMMDVTTPALQPFERCPAPTYGFAGATWSLPGSCIGYVSITNGSITVNSPAMSTYTANYLNIDNNVVNGTYPTLYTANSNLTGVTTGWTGTVGSPRKLRWKNISAIAANNGNWEDPNNWELVSGGAGTQTILAPAPQCPPTRIDTALFDNTSFTAINQRVTINSAICDIGSMYWRTTANTPELYCTPTGTNTLHVYASLMFGSSMQQNFSGPVLFRGSPSYGPSTFSISTITSNGQSFKNYLTFDADGTNKIWQLTDNMTALFNSPNAFISTAPAVFNFTEGEFRSSGYTMNIADFLSSGTLNRTLDIRNSIINLSKTILGSGSSWWVSGPTNFNILSSGSLINAIQVFYGGGKKYYDVTFTSASYNIVGANGATGDEFHILTFNTLAGSPGNSLGSSIYGLNNNLRIHQLIGNENFTINAPNCVIDSMICNKNAIFSSNNKYNKYVKFTGGRTYTMGSGNVQWFQNRCQVDLFGTSGNNIQLYSSTTSQQSYLRKDSAYMCTDFINMRDIWALGNGNNIGTCVSYSNSGINTTCATTTLNATHAVSLCDTITDLASSCGPWDLNNLSRGRADFNAGTNADLQGNDFGWAKRGYPPTPILNLASASTSVCPGTAVTLTLTGVANPPFSLFYVENGTTVPLSVSSATDLVTYNSSTGDFTYTVSVTPTVNTTYQLGFLIIDRCFNPQSATGTGTVNVTMRSIPSGITSNFTPSALVCNGAVLTLTSTSTSGTTYTLYPASTGTAGAIPMTSYTVGAATNGSVSLSATGSYTAGSSPATYTLYTDVATQFGCPAVSRIPVSFTVNPTPQITNASAQSICTGNTAIISAVTNFTDNVVTSWSSASVAGITGHATSGSGNDISETLINTTNTPKMVAYTYTPTVGSCAGTAQQFTVTVNPAPVMSSVTNTTICSGNTLSFGLTSNIAGSTYQWTASDNTNTSGETTTTQNTSTISDAITNNGTSLQQVTYTVTPTSTLGSCIGASQTVTVDINPTPQVTSTQTTVICSGNSVNLALSANVASTYTWVAASNTNVTGESTTNVVSNTINNTLNTTAGGAAETVIYTVTPMSTAGNCLGTAQQVTVTVNSTPTVTAIAANSGSICANTTATIQATGGDTYTWSPSSNLSANIGNEVSFTAPTSTNAITYTYNIVTTNTTTGCSNLASPFTVTVTGLGAPIVTSASTSTVCSGVAVNMNLTSTSASTFNWLASDNTNTSGESTVAQSAAILNDAITNTTTAIQNVIYTVTPTSTLGSCLGTPETVTISINPTPQVTSINTSTVCSGNSVSIPLTSNVASTYTWVAASNANVTGESTSNQTTNSINNTLSTAVGSAAEVVLYTVTPMSSAGNCLGTAQQVSVTVNSSPSVTAVSSSTAICSGNTATLTAAGADTYTWTSGPSTSTYTVNTANTYSVVGTNTLTGCTNTTNVSLTVNPTPTVSIAASSGTICAGQTTTLTASTANDYSWSSGQSVSSINVAPTTNTVYTVVGTNTAGTCTASAQYSVTVNPKPDMVLTNTTGIVCLGDANGTATVNVTSGTSGYNYTWTGSASTASVATGLSSGTHTAIVTDARGCKDTLLVTIAAPSASLSTAIATSTTGCSLSDGTATLTVSGGWNLGYTYVWQANASNTNTATGYAAGSYTAQVTDANGCVKIQNFTITNPSTPTISAIASNPTICSGLTTTITPSGAVSYTISGGSVSSSTVGTTFEVNPTSNTTYSIVGTDASNCISTTATVAINVNTTPTVAITASNNTICIGASTSLNLSGASTYTLLNTSAPITNGTIFSPTVTTTYSIQGATGTCTSLATQQVITVNALPVITAVPSSTAICSGNTATLTAAGANTYTWTNPASTNTVVTVNPSTTTNYIVTGTDVNGCVNTQTVSLTVNATPTVAISASSATICSGQTTTLNVATADLYTWSNGLPSTASNTVAPIANTVYTVTGTNTAGSCTATAQFSVTVNATPTVAISASSGTICSGQTTTLTAATANAYSWSSGQTVNAITVAPTTNTVYTVIGTNTAGSCTATAQYSLTVNATPTVAISASSGTICSGQTTTLNVATADMYTWSNGLPSTASNTVAPIANTIYTVTGTNTAGTCTATAQFTVTVNQLPTITASTITNVSCFGLNNGSVNFTPAAGTPTYTIAGTNVSGTTATGLAPNNYTYTVTDAAGCVNTTTLAITEPTAALLATAVETATNTSCTSADGIAAVSITGGTSGYTINPSSGVVSGNTITGLNTGAHTFTVTDVNGCTATNSVTIAGATGITSTLTAQSNVLCFGNNTASVTVSGIGEASGTYNYTLTNTGTGLPVANNNTGLFTNLPAGTYSVNILGGVSNCVSSQNITITQPSSALSLTGVTANSVVCNGGTALATATVAGGTGPYTYIWSSNTNTTTANTTSSVTYTAGGYSVDITDANGCTLATQNFTINEAPVLTVASVATTTTGCGLSNGTATVNANGGWSSYTYTITDSGNAVVSNTNTVTNLSAGIYTANISDALGCTTQTVFSIMNPSTPSLSITSNVATICAGETTTITPTGAASYSLNGTTFSGTSTETVSPTVTTVYNIIGTDAANCVSAPLTVTVNVNALPTISLTATSAAICAGQSATLTANGADTYTWSSSANTTNTEIVNPSAQTVYTAQGTNTLTGCTSSVVASYTVNVNALPTVAVASQTNVTCFGDANGTIEISSTSTNTSVIEPTTALSAGNYTFTIVDNTTACTNTVAATIAGPTASLAISSVVTQTAACATANGSATITAVDGWSSSYTYSVNGTATGSVVSGLQAGNYTAQVSDAMGCLSSSTFTIVNPNAPTLSIASNTTVICAGETTTITPTGAVSYTLTSPTTTFVTSANVSPTVTTVYNIIGTDASNCVSAPLTVTITVNALPTISITASTSSICAGQSATLTASGADAYVWNSSANTTNTEVVNPSIQTVYTAQGTNTLTGCTSSVAASYTVNVNALPTATITNQSNVLCFGQANGSVSLTTSPSNAVVSPTVTGLSVGVHTFTVNDNGCMSTISATITGPSAPLSASVSNTTTNTSCSTPNGSYTVTASGGTPNYTYTSASTNTTGIFVNQGTGTHNISIVDGNGCTYSVSAIIPGANTPSIAATTQTNVLCNGGNNGAASINVINGTPTYTYSWSNNLGLNSNTQTNMLVGSYTVTATDAGSCTVTQVFVITEPNAINAITSSLSNPCVGQNNGAISIEINGGTPNYQVVWNPNGNVSTIGNSSTINDIAEGQYIATITDANACSYQYPVQLVAADGIGCTLVIPEIFSPNGDGKNDTWEIKGLENYPNNNVTVFNRWGDQVFKAEPYKNDWDGSNTGDKSILGKGALPVGTYYFILDLGNGDKPITGYVQLTK